MLTSVNAMTCPLSFFRNFRIRIQRSLHTAVVALIGGEMHQAQPVAKKPGSPHRNGCFNSGRTVKKAQPFKSFEGETDYPPVARWDAMGISGFPRAHS
jgi:hypothetical protein